MPHYNLRHITKCRNRYYKMRNVLQNAAEHTCCLSVVYALMVD